MDHETAERLISARLDGERRSARHADALERHLGTCARCRSFERGAWRLREIARFQVAPAVPDLVEAIMASVAEQARGASAGLPPVRDPRALGRRRPLLLRLAPTLAAVLAGMLAGSLVVGGPRHDRLPGTPALAAADVARGVAGAASRLEAYRATFAITEYHLSPEVPVRRLVMDVWFRAPERFRLDVVDHTSYPTPATPTDLRLIVDGSAWYASGPAPCPSATCPQRETLVRNRAPFSHAAPVPTDLVLPLTTFADGRGVTVLGRGRALGRAAVLVEVPFERAEPLFPFLALGGEWRPFFPSDRVRIWLDERSWFPLRWEVFPAGGRARDAWALRFGLPEEPSRRAIFEVEALDVRLSPPPAGIFEIPATGRAEDQGARAVGLEEASREAGFEPLTPAEVAGLDLYRVVVPEVAGGETLIAYADGLSFLKLGETRSWAGDGPFGPVGLHAEEVVLGNGGVAYYEPATPDQGRRLSIHAAGTDLYLESNLPRDELLAIAASLPVTGLRMPPAWRIREAADGTLERVTLEEASAAVPFPIEPPRALPAGFALASVELVRVGGEAGVTLYFQDANADVGIGPVRLHLEAADALPPATSARQVAVQVRGAEGRFTPDRSQLEWIEDGLYRSIDAPGLGLEELLAIASSIGPPPSPGAPT